METYLAYSNWKLPCASATQSRVHRNLPTAGLLHNIIGCRDSAGFEPIGRPYGNRSSTSMNIAEATARPSVFQRLIARQKASTMITIMPLVRSIASLFYLQP